MPNRRANRNAYYFFVQEKIPELRQRGLPVARVADAIPYCSADWALLREDEKEKYSEMAREWRAAQGKDSGPSEKQVEPENRQEVSRRCKWHEENDILFCALAVCKKIAYCISNSLATLFGIQLTGAHVPLQDYEASNSVTPKMVVLDAGRYQKLRVKSPGFCHFNSYKQEQRSNTSTGCYPSGVKISGPNSSVRGRGITRLLGSISSSSNIHRFSNCETSLSTYMSQKDGYKSFSSFS
ncbi:Protein maelstrom-like protein [Microtus ochrogaster]|uniref:Protein maelstrom homolog n=1 Tax=Microtus ochrogaster TaxID=79684 RepID=A0A8J6G0K8_MICOH|nr:Protein maelstrom-like protein [Microtus ochrogaster]